MITLREHLKAKGQYIATDDSFIIVRNPIKILCMRGLFPIVIEVKDKTGKVIKEINNR